MVLAALAWVVLLAPHATGAVLPLQSRGPLRLADLGRARSAHTLPLRRNTNVTQGNNHTNHTYETTSSPFSTSTTSTSSTPTPAPTTNSSNASTDDVGSSPVGAATPAPPTGSGGAAVATESFFLQLAVVLPYTKAEFDAEKQQAYRTALAIASKTDVDKVEIVSITDSRRRAGRITVVTRITADDAAAVTALRNTLGTGDALKAKINKELVAQGLSEALDVSRPTVGGEAIEEDCGGGNMKDGFSGFWARLKACRATFSIQEAPSSCTLWAHLPASWCFAAGQHSQACSCADAATGGLRHLILIRDGGLGHHQASCWRPNRAARMWSAGLGAPPLSRPHGISGRRQAGFVWQQMLGRRRRRRMKSAFC